LLLPFRKKEAGKFHLPYINGKWIVLVLFLLIVFFMQDRLISALTNISQEAYQEWLFLIFILLTAFISILTFIRNYSLIPVLGVLCCLYLMIEIPAKSWMVFFGWMSLGLLIYVMYGRRKSKLVSINNHEISTGG
jgi:hypothetical protein